SPHSSPPHLYTLSLHDALPISAYTLLKNEGVQPMTVVGHSLGEYSALVAAGTLTLDEALPLVKTRGRLMEEAFPKGKGTMAAVRSEEHTSELQSRFDLVCRLLL